jgi:hypothetical protein
MARDNRTISIGGAQPAAQPEPAKQAEDTDTPTSAPKRTVKMHRLEEDARSGPREADVDPAEVNNMIAGGWRVTE